MLIHVPERAQALQRLVAALKPGGWLLAEDGDFSTWEPLPSVDPALADIFRRHWRVVERFWTQRGMAPHYGRQLYGELRAAELHNVHAEGRLTVASGASPAATTFRLTWEQLREPVLASAEVSAAELDRLLAAFADPDFAWMSTTTWAVRGCRPAL